MSTLAKTAIAAALLAICCWTGIAFAAEKVPSMDVTFFHVPLTCPAAQGLGCGPRARPLLLELEQADVIDEAWLHHSGEMLAVKWRAHSAVGDQSRTLAALSKKHAVTLEELDGAVHDALLPDFRAANGWHRGADVDRLSEEEAHVIADRFLNRMIAKVPGARGKAESLRPLLTEGIRDHLVSDTLSREECRDKLIDVARSHLSKAELAALVEALELGFRPVGNER